MNLPERHGTKSKSLVSIVDDGLLVVAALVGAIVLLKVFGFIAGAIWTLVKLAAVAGAVYVILRALRSRGR